MKPIKMKPQKSEGLSLNLLQDMKDVYGFMVQTCMSGKLSDNKLVNDRILKKALTYILLEIASIDCRCSQPFAAYYLKEYDDIHHIMQLAYYSVDEMLHVIKKIN